jgi:hypothetical protein
MRPVLLFPLSSCGLLTTTTSRAGKGRHAPWYIFSSKFSYLVKVPLEALTTLLDQGLQVLYLMLHITQLLECILVFGLLLQGNAGLCQMLVCVWWLSWNHCR